MRWGMLWLLGAWWACAPGSAVSPFSREALVLFSISEGKKRCLDSGEGGILGEEPVTLEVPLVARPG